MLARVWHRLYVEIGLKAWMVSPYNTKILCLQRYFRFLAYGGSTLILALSLSSLEVSDQKIGPFMTLTLLGDVFVSLISTAIADSIGRRRILAIGALLMTASVLAMFQGHRTAEEQALENFDSQIQHVREEDSDDVRNPV
ncbi:hypothetical protein A1O3_08109 [Capronia epimyces CBS 606.96]|uniref:Major facilitator superfamily (MFS) profile domain-containing protein n=1 Tax=Capronia epimyces CBS 606.96 TaxID=1182542 RepID=W9YBU6_9EURO|nr:uncharacterized protein A1O3_08109 [Capronia epimyces CBS 606.96]EXJ79824.1 hypothetical protein A1O3_08109 [Capronia epimyces CBS 606.96]